MPYKIPPAHPKKYNYPGFGGEWAIANLAVQDCSNMCKDGTVRITTNSKKKLFIKYIFIHIVFQPLSCWL